MKHYTDFGLYMDTIFNMHDLSAKTLFIVYKMYIYFLFNLSTFCFYFVIIRYIDFNKVMNLYLLIVCLTMF